MSVLEIDPITATYIVAGVVMILAIPFAIFKWKESDWVLQRLGFFRDLDTFLAVVLAASLAGWLTGGNLALPFPESEISTHPFLTPVTYVMSIIFLTVTIVVLYADWKKDLRHKRAS